MTEKTVTGTEAMVFFCKSSPHPVFLLVVPGTDPLLSCLRATTLHMSPHRCSYSPWDLPYLALPLFLVSMPLCSTLHHSHPALMSPPLLSPLFQGLISHHTPFCPPSTSVEVLDCPSGVVPFPSSVTCHILFLLLDCSSHSSVPQDEAQIAYLPKLSSVISIFLYKLNIISMFSSLPLYYRWTIFMVHMSSYHLIIIWKIYSSPNLGCPRLNCHHHLRWLMPTTF